MSTSDKEQKSVLVKQHKRIARGEKLDGQSLKEKEQKGGLQQAKEKK